MTKEEGELIGVMETGDDYELKYRADCTKCKHCDKYILKSNYMMHELHCSKIYANSASASTQKPESATGTSSKPIVVKPKVKVDKLKTASNDIDELLEISTQMNNVCNLNDVKQRFKH